MRNPRQKARLATLACCLLAALLSTLAAAGGDAGKQGGPGSKRGAGSFLVWWQQEKVCTELGLGAELRKKIAAELDNLQTSYQLTQTRLNDARKMQTALLLGADFDREKVKAFNQKEVVPLSEKMQALNFEARLVVRAALSAEQLAKIAAQHPRFFTARWFKTSPLPVREGQVVVEDE